MDGWHYQPASGGEEIVQAIICKDGNVSAPAAVILPGRGGLSTPVMALDKGQLLLLFGGISTSKESVLRDGNLYGATKNSGEWKLNRRAWRTKLIRGGWPCPGRVHGLFRYRCGKVALEAPLDIDSG